jgi:hypothetical protein
MITEDRRTAQARTRAARMDGARGRAEQMVVLLGGATALLLFLIV